MLTATSTGMQVLTTAHPYTSFPEQIQKVFKNSFTVKHVTIVVLVVPEVSTYGESLWHQGKEALSTLVVPLRFPAWIMLQQRKIVILIHSQ